MKRYKGGTLATLKTTELYNWKMRGIHLTHLHEDQIRAGFKPFSIQYVKLCTHSLKTSISLLNFNMNCAQTSPGHTAQLTLKESLKRVKTKTYCVKTKGPNTDECRMSVKHKITQKVRWSRFSCRFKRRTCRRRGRRHPPLRSRKGSSNKTYGLSS